MYLMISVGKALLKSLVPRQPGQLCQELHGSPWMGWFCWQPWPNPVLAVSKIYFQSSANREVAGAALNFLKVFGTSTPILSSTKFVVSIVKSCMRTAGNHNRAKIDLGEWDYTWPNVRLHCTRGSVV